MGNHRYAWCGSGVEWTISSANRATKVQRIRIATSIWFWFWIYYSFSKASPVVRLVPFPTRGYSYVSGCSNYSWLIVPVRWIYQRHYSWRIHNPSNLRRPSNLDSASARNRVKASWDHAHAFRRCKWRILIHAYHAGLFAGSVSELEILVVDLACPFGWTKFSRCILNRSSCDWTPSVTPSVATPTETRCRTFRSQSVAWWPRLHATKRSLLQCSLQVSRLDLSGLFRNIHYPCQKARYAKLLPLFKP